MTDRVPNIALAERFAALVALVNDRPSAVMEQREAARAVTEAARAGAVTLSLQHGALLADGAPFDSPLLASRFGTYGLEELGVTERAAQADLLDVARLLAAAPGDGDPVARFAARQTALDAKALPRRLRARGTVEAEPSAPSRVTPAAPAKRVSGQSARLAPGVQASIAPRPSRPSVPGVPVVAPEPSESAPPPDVPGPIAPRPRTTPVALKLALAAPPEPVLEARDAPERLAEALPIPEVAEGTLAAARLAIEMADTPQRLGAALEQLVTLSDLAFRQGRHDDLVESLTTLVGLEFELLARDDSDARRQALNHAVRKLAKPVLLRQLAVLRHVRAADAVASLRLQQVIFRFGVDGVEAVIDEFASAPTDEARAVCVECLRGLRRTYDALHAFAHDPRELVVRQIAQLLGELRDPRAYALLAELLQHPDERTRRIAVAAFAESGRDDAIEAVAFALEDESPLVRLRAVAALAGRRDPDVLRSLIALIERETDREVLYAAIGAVGAIATPDAVQALIPIAQGEGANPLRRAAAMRIQACTALVIIRTPVAMAAVQVLRADRDREVREASVRLVAQAARRTTTSGIAVVSAP